MKFIKKNYINILFLCLTNTFVFAQKSSDSLVITINEHEKWFGGAVNDAIQMPFKPGYMFDMYGNNKGNQIQPLLLSNRGRVIWSEEPLAINITENTVNIKVRKGKIKFSTGGKTLKEAFQWAAKQYFPANGKMPDELLFKQPQYNTWIELMYDQNQKDILEYAHAIIDNGLPLGVLMIDDNWQEDYGKWNFHHGRFPDPKAMMKELHDLGFKVMLWVCPFVSPDTEEYRALEKKGAFLRNPKNVEQAAKPWVAQGTPAMIRWWNGVSAVLDLSNPTDVAWFKGKLQWLIDEYGVDGYKLDAGDTSFYPERLVSYKGNITPNEHTKLFGEIGLSFRLNEYRAMWKMAGQPLAQRLSDKGHSWYDLKKLIPSITVQGLLGYAFTCPDMIGGGEFNSFLNASSVDQDLVVRSAQTHALMPMMQFSVAPWRILDKEHLDAVKKAVELRKQFVPEIMKLARLATTTGMPIVRTMDFVFPNEGFENIQDQFVLGDNILVAPHLEKNTLERVVYLPKGKWKSDEGEVIRGGKSITTVVPLDRLPYFIKVK
ncbi:glycoside hydrolase family 31 protein [Aureibaculum conchae]|uniref:glycoside hydrolase family 31 protein n=1 Tax=Aureibaculum sp. 2308TA14-22 TaxID=3108392 RepID=UPI003391669B